MEWRTDLGSRFLLRAITWVGLGFAAVVSVRVFSIFFCHDEVEERWQGRFEVLGPVGGTRFFDPFPLSILLSSLLLGD